MNELKELNTINPIIEERIKREKEFHQNRIMFYFKDDNIIFPKYNNINLSHKEWFKRENIDINNVIRGYKMGFDVFIYIGENFEVPNVTYNMIKQIQYLFKDIWNIYLGCIPGELGEKWKGIEQIKITSV